jgi:hypothetical protein
VGGLNEYLPEPCVLHPERVFEYPDRWELTDAQAKRLAESPDLTAVAARAGRGLPDDGSRPGDAASLYQRWLGAAPGTKAGGYPAWVQEPRYPACEFCGVPMAHLLSLASWEWDGGTWPRWMPVEHREQDRFRAGKAAGWMLGDAGNFYLFICRGCDGRPVRWAVQSS